MAYDICGLCEEPVDLSLDGITTDGCATIVCESCISEGYVLFDHTVDGETFTFINEDMLD